MSTVMLGPRCRAGRSWRNAPERRAAAARRQPMAASAQRTLPPSDLCPLAFPRRRKLTILLCCAVSLALVPISGERLAGGAA